MNTLNHPMVIRFSDWPIAAAALICATMVALPVSELLETQETQQAEPAPEQPAPAKPKVSYAPAPGRDDRTPVEYLSQIFDLADPDLVGKLTGVGPVFWNNSSQATGALISDSLVLTTAHMFVKDGTWKGGNTLLPIPPDPAKGEIFLAVCGQSYAFTKIEVGSEAPRKSLGLDYAIAQLKEPACKEATVLPVDGAYEGDIPSPKTEAPIILNIGAYQFGDLDRYKQHPLFDGRNVGADPMQHYHMFGVRCRIKAFVTPTGLKGGNTGLINTEGCDAVPGGSGGPLLISRDGGQNYQIIGVANSYRPNSEFNNYTRIIGDFAAHLARHLPDFSGNVSDAPSSAAPVSGPWVAMGGRS